MNANLKTHKDLDAWKRSMDLVETIYKATKEFPPEELYGLTSQLRRAAVSIPSNIVYPVKYAERELFHGARGGEEFHQGVPPISACCIGVCL